MFECYFCHKHKHGNWEHIDWRCQWVCYDCEDKIPEKVINPCWKHGLPMREYGGCVACHPEEEEE